MPWKLKYEKDDDMVALDFETKNQLDDYIKSNKRKLRLRSQFQANIKPFNDYLIKCNQEG